MVNLKQWKKKKPDNEFKNVSDNLYMKMYIKDLTHFIYPEVVQLLLIMGCPT